MADPTFRYPKQAHQGTIPNGQQAAASPPAQPGVNSGAYPNQMIGQPAPIVGMQGQANAYQMPYSAPVMPQNTGQMSMAPGAQPMYYGTAPNMYQGGAPTVQQMPYGTAPAAFPGGNQMNFMGQTPAAQQMPYRPAPGGDQMNFMGQTPAAQQMPYRPAPGGDQMNFMGQTPAAQQMPYRPAPGGNQMNFMGQTPAMQPANYGAVPQGGVQASFMQGPFLPQGTAPVPGPQMYYGGNQMPSSGGSGQPWNQQSQWQIPGQGYLQSAFQGMQMPVDDVIVRTIPGQSASPAFAKPNLPAKTGFQVAYGMPPPAAAPKVEQKPVPLRPCNACKQQVPETEIYSKKCPDATCSVCWKCVKDAYLADDSPICPGCKRDYSAVELTEIHEVMIYTPEYQGKAGNTPKRPGAKDMVTCVFGHDTNKVNLIENACPRGCLVCRQHYQQAPKCSCGAMLGMHLNGDLNQFAAEEAKQL